MAFNHLTLNLELLSYYNAIWSRMTSTNAASLEEARKQNGERIRLIQKMTFIGLMSSVEFSFKEYIKIFPSKIGNCKNTKGRVYLSGIVNESKFINEVDLELWKGLIKLRNILVHNNGISDVTKNYSYPSSQLILVDGRMTRGDLKLFPSLIDWLLDASKQWVYEMHKIT